MGPWRAGGRRLVIGCFVSITRNALLYIFISTTLEGSIAASLSIGELSRVEGVTLPSSAHHKNNTSFPLPSASPPLKLGAQLSPLQPNTQLVWFSFANHYEILLQYFTNGSAVF